MKHSSEQALILAEDLWRIVSCDSCYYSKAVTFSAVSTLRDNAMKRDGQLFFSFFLSFLNKSKAEKLQMLQINELQCLRLTRDSIKPRLQQQWCCSLQLEEPWLPTKSYSEFLCDTSPTSTPITPAWTVAPSSPGGPEEEREPSRLWQMELVMIKWSWCLVRLMMISTFKSNGSQVHRVCRVYSIWRGKQDD